MVRGEWKRRCGSGRRSYFLYLIHHYVNYRLNWNLQLLSLVLHVQRSVIHVSKYMKLDQVNSVYHSWRSLVRTFVRVAALSCGYTCQKLRRFIFNASGKLISSLLPATLLTIPQTLRCIQTVGLPLLPEPPLGIIVIRRVSCFYHCRFRSAASVSSVCWSPAVTSDLLI